MLFLFVPHSLLGIFLLYVWYTLIWGSYFWNLTVLLIGEVKKKQKQKRTRPASHQLFRGQTSPLPSLSPLLPLPALPHQHFFELNHVREASSRPASLRRTAELSTGRCLQLKTKAKAAGLLPRPPARRASRTRAERGSLAGAPTAGTPRARLPPATATRQPPHRQQATACPPRGFPGGGDPLPVPVRC